MSIKGYQRVKEKFNRNGRFFVYILKCRDGTYYTGYTNDLSNRINRHNKGIASKYTQRRLPVRLVWSKEYKYFKRAFLEEIRIKKLTRKQKIELVNGKRLDKVFEKAKK